MAIPLLTTNLFRTNIIKIIGNIDWDIPPISRTIDLSKL
jgi:hypothetical protein